MEDYIDKYNLKSEGLSLEKQDSEKAIEFYNDLLNNELFANDYYPYRRLVLMYKKTKNTTKQIEIIKKFFKSGIYANEYQTLWFENKLRILKETDVDDYIDYFNEHSLKNKNLANIKLQFVGSARHSYLNHILTKYNLHAMVQQSGRVKKQELKSYLENASVFLHLKYGDKTGIITSKQADYLAFKKPILLPVSDNGDLAESILYHKAGYVCNTVEENVAILESLYQKFQNGESLIIAQSEEMLLKNSRPYIAKEFVDLVLKA